MLFETLMAILESHSKRGSESHVIRALFYLKMAEWRSCVVCVKTEQHGDECTMVRMTRVDVADWKNF